MTIVVMVLIELVNMYVLLKAGMREWNLNDNDRWVQRKKMRDAPNCLRIRRRFFLLHNNITTIDHSHDDFAWDRTTDDTVEEVIF